MDKLKIAIIGVGGIAGLHYSAYKKLSNVEVYALCDINEKQLNKRGAEWGIIRLYTDVNEMLAALPEIDAVSVCTWNSAHACCTIAALNAGKHVLCEKPMCMSVEEALEMKAAQERSGKLLMIGFVRRSGNDCRIIKEFIDNLNKQGISATLRHSMGNDIDGACGQLRVKYLAEHDAVNRGTNED